MIIGPGDDILPDGICVLPDGAMVVICISTSHASTSSLVRGEDWAPVLQDVEGTIEVLC